MRFGDLVYNRGVVTVDFAPVVLVELPAVVIPISHIRGAALIASLQVLAEMGHRERILSPLGAEDRGIIEELTASSWIPIAPALAYYESVDQLGLTSEQSERIGEQVADRTQSAFRATLLRGLRGLVTPATVLSRMDRFWSRSSRGGAPRVLQTGRAEVRIEVHGAQFLEFAYNRAALMGYYKQAVAPTARQVSIRETTRPGPQAAAWILSWT
jgi:hypothetical protein